MQKPAVLFKNHRLLILTCAVTGALTVFTAAYFTYADKPPKNIHLSGGAEAVMTTPVKTIDGMLDEGVYHDELYGPLGIVLADEAVIVADSISDRIQIISDDNITRIGAYGVDDNSFASSGGYVDGYIEDAQFNKPADVALLNGDIIVCDAGNNAIRRISGNTLFTIAGGQAAGYSNGKEGEALFNSPQAIAVSPDGTIYVADTLNHCIRAIDSGGNVVLFAGKPEQSGFADGGVFDAMFFEPCGLYFANDGALYVADTANHSIRMIKDGVVSTIAGKPGTSSDETSAGYTNGGFKDGENTEAEFCYPRALVVLSGGDIYVADTLNHAVRLISRERTVTVLGNGEAGDFYGSAENIRLAKPSGIASNGKELYISDAMNNSIAVIPISGELNAGRPLREEMIKATELYTKTRYDYEGEIRLFVNGERVRFDKVYAWNTPDNIYIPVRPLFEALGAVVEIEKETKDLIIDFDGIKTVIGLNESYFTRKGVAVMPFDEIMRLFPYPIEWFPEFSVIIAYKEN